jgi:hypothetical protein
LCKYKKIPLCTTKTVQYEATQNFPKIVGRYLDKVGVKERIAREHLYNKFRLRLADLFRFCRVEKVNAKTDKIRVMYRNFANDPALLKVLKSLQIEKHRSSLFPSETDMRILAEADQFGEKFEVSFITDDKDFLLFTDEIESRLQVRIFALLDLGHYFDV